MLAAPPSGGIVGTPGAGGNARIEEDRSESVRIAVHAEAAGFLVLTDQDYPGWTLTVNGAPAAVLQANHAFRAVAVPPGDHTVVWTYRPMSVKLGLAVSLVTLVAIAIAVARGGRSWFLGPIP